MEKKEYTRKPDKITIEEIIAIIIFLVGVYLTNNAPFCMTLSIVSLIVMIITYRILWREKIKPLLIKMNDFYEIFKTIQKINFYLMGLVAILLALDTFSTIMSVHILKIGIEQNQIVVGLWENLGIIQGYILFDLVRFGGLALSSIPNFLKIKRNIRQKEAFLILSSISFYLVWIIVIIPVLINNFSILWSEI